MEFRFTEQEQAFRQEVRDFLRHELPADWNHHPTEYDPMEIPEGLWEFAWAFTKKLAARKWLAPAWPAEFGGLGLDHMRQVIMAEEMAYCRAPSTAYVGVSLAGPTVILHGTDEQKRELLPGITSGEEMWCQGYSEPNAGSDLASIVTTATRDRDDYVVNGQKIWSSWAHKATWCFFLARTDTQAPKHKGISYFVVPMNTPGITVAPLVNLAGIHEFNEMFFEDVRVPSRYLIGEENRGWYVAMSTLDFERSMISWGAGAQRTFDDLVAYCRTSSVRLPHPTRSRLAEVAIELQIGRLLSYRVASLQAGDELPTYEASAAKLYHSEVIQHLASLGLEVLALHGQLREGSLHSRLRGHFAQIHLTGTGATIAAGSSEIQRNVIATRGLQLPRN